MIALNDVCASFQGEGVLSGTPMVLIRLQGCGVGCPWCDSRPTWERGRDDVVEEIDEATKDDKKWAYADPAEIARKAREVGPNLKWALVTGGEPAEQDLGDLVRELHGVGFKAALETSGTANGFVDCGFDWVCVSPKIDMPGGKTFDPYLLRYADEIKQVIASKRDVDQLETMVDSVVTKKGAVISIQPVSKNEKATRLCLETCLRKGWNLSIQIHRYINVR